MRIAIVTSDLRGPIKCGGVGTAYSELAMTLVSQGHEVTVFFLLIPGRPVKDFARHQRQYQKNGIRLEALKNPAVAVDGPEVVREAYAVYLNLKGSQFDLIHFPDMHGLGYFCMAAKRGGLDFQRTQFAVILNGPSHWHKWGNQQHFESLIDLQYLYLERKTVEWADILISPSQHAVDWARREGWVLPKQTNVIQYPYNLPLATIRESTEIQEIVFFGRLEVRKGLDIFVDALESMDPAILQGKKIVFLGKSGVMNRGEGAAEFLRRRSAHWSFQWELKTDLGQEEAIRYLITKNAFAVMPSRDETLGYTVMECLGNQIPFLALDIAPFRELIHPDDVENVLATEVEFHTRLAAKLATSQASARFRTPPRQTLQIWRKLHDQIERDVVAPAADAGVPLLPDRVSLTVAILHKDRPEYLNQCLQSLEQQALGFDICIIDNHSAQPVAKAYLAALEDQPRFRVMRLNEALEPAAARNHAAEVLKTDWILWLDDDNLIKPHGVEKMWTAALRTRAPLVSAALDCFESRLSPLTTAMPVVYRTIFMGPDPALGFFRNIYGDTASLVHRETFLKIGGFRAARDIGNEDWEFYTRAVLAGYDLTVLPEALFWYRLSEDSRSQTMNGYASERFRRAPYENLVTGGWLPALLDLSFGHLNLTPQPAQNPPSDHDLRRAKRLAANTPILGNIENDLYQDRVRRTGKLIFEAGPSNRFDNIKSLWHCRLDKFGSAMSIFAEGIDPAIEISIPEFPTGARLRLDVEVEVGRHTQMQVFYKVASADAYDEKKSLLTQLRPGVQEVSIWLPETCVGGVLRLDPVCEQINSKIESIRLYALDENPMLISEAQNDSNFASLDGSTSEIAHSDGEPRGLYFSGIATEI